MCAEIQENTDIAEKEISEMVVSDWSSDVCYSDLVMQEFLAPIRARREEYEKDKEQLIEILKKGTQRAIEVSNETVSEIRNAIGINYFNDKTFIDVCRVSIH